jgi:hypothetical protein
MLYGVSGHLLSGAFLERLVADLPPGDPDRQLQRHLAAWRQRSRGLGPSSSLRAMLNAGAGPLLAVFGFRPGIAITPHERSLAATVLGGARPVALLVARWGEPLDPLWREAVIEAIARLAPCCLIYNGTHLRVIDGERLFTRRYSEFDLERTLDDPRSSSALRLVLQHSLPDIVSRSDRYASRVCRALKDGVRTASTEVLRALLGPRPAGHRLEAAFEQALTVVYRIVFLLFAEARALVPTWHPIYRDSYSIAALLDAAQGTRETTGLWDALRAIARLAHAGCLAGDLRVTPFNGRLFAPARTPLAERRHIDEGCARRALLALGTQAAAGGQGRERIAYRDLGVEQIGAVYETLLDYRPVVDRASTPSARRVELQPGSGVRKATGTFYTPQPIAEYIVRRTLGPLVRDADPPRILELRVLDPAMGSGAFLVAACRYLAAAYEAALVRAGACHASDIDEPERMLIRRTIAERCLYGVDVNPMAVQLARLSIWLTTLAGDRPLSFLDHRLHAGDSLVGAWLGLLGRKPAGRGRRRRASADQPSLFEEVYARHALREVLPARFSLESGPSDTVERIREKERILASMNSRGSALERWRRLANVWCAAWLAGDRVPPDAFRALSDAVLGRGGPLPPHAASGYLQDAEEIASRQRFFHWELECPEVFFDANGARLLRGGFDAVLGNPPWDMIRADRPPDDAAGEIGPGRLLRFARDSGLYSARSEGHANCYQLFTERAIVLARPGGRIGLVLPSGLLVDHGSASLRRLLLGTCDVDALVGFENRRGVFQIHRGLRFVLVTATAGNPTESIACRFAVEDPDELETVGEEPARTQTWFPVRIRPALLQRISGPDLAVPWIRTPTDLAIVERAATLFPPLGSGQGWSARFGRELNVTEDRRLLRAASGGLQVVEGRQISPFAVDLRGSRWTVRARDARERLNDGRYERPRLAYRDVAGAANRLTLVAAVLPAGCVSVHTVFCLRSPFRLADHHLLCGLFNSFVLNYLVRLRVSTHVTTAIVEALPVPTRDQAPHAMRRIAALARARARRPDPAADAALQAQVAALYQLSAAEFAHVLDTFPLIPKTARDAALNALG